jgi:2-oxo-4-hydroxy-4-carboxy--5-ureidoimidazoline (OHCU) decarboxylase
MVDFDMKPHKKPPEEVEFNRLNVVYEAKFGKPYVFYMETVIQTWEETLSDIRERIAKNNPQKHE